MSLSPDSVALHHKRTATERALNNADPLVIKKKARQAGVTLAKSNPPTNGPIMTNLGCRASVHMQCDDNLPSEGEPIPPTKSGMTSSDTQANTAQMSAPSQNKSHRHIHMEEVDNKDKNLHYYSHNPLQLSVSHILELSDDDCPPLIVREDKEESDDDKDDEEVDVPKRN